MDIGRGGSMMTRQEVAEWLGCHEDTVARYVKAKRLACYRLPGGRMRFDPGEVQRFIATLDDASEAVG